MNVTWRSLSEWENDFIYIDNRLCGDMTSYIYSLLIIMYQKWWRYMYLSSLNQVISSRLYQCPLYTIGYICCNFMIPQYKSLWLSWIDYIVNVIWVRSRNCGCLVTWFCYQLIAKPGNKTATVSWPDPYVDGLAQDWSNSIAHTLTLLQSCIKPLICM